MESYVPGYMDRNEAPFLLAAPAVMVYIINYLMSKSTQISSGHLDNLELETQASKFSHRASW